MGNARAKGKANGVREHGAGADAAASEPDRPSAKRPRLTTNRPRGRDIILLSLFDGVGAAPYIIDRDFGRPRLAVSWEVDRACKALVQKALPWVEHRGDFARDSPRDVADLVLDADPNAEAMVVWCAAPPCQDFSRIAQGAGHQGDRGRLFEESVNFMDELRAALKSHRFAFLYENVEMSAEAAKVSSAALGVQPVFVCPSDFGWVSRPRLWWLSIDWTRLVSDPDDGSPLSGRRRAGGIAFGWPRSGPRPTPSTGGLAFHSSVAPGEKAHALRHDAGADRRRAGQAAVDPRTDPSRRRPVAGGRSPVRPMALHRGGHAPGCQGCPSHPAAGGEGAAPPHTAWVHRQSRGRRQTRHRMVGNGWHWGVASRLLGLLIMTTGHGACSHTTPGHYPLAVPAMDPSGLGLRAPPRPNPQVLGEGLDEDSHWAAAARMAHSLVGWPSLEPALEAVLEFRSLASARTSSTSSGSWSRTPRTTPPRGWRLCPRMCAPLTSVRTGPGPFRALCSIACSGAWVTRRPTTSNKT